MADNVQTQDVTGVVEKPPTLEEQIASLQAAIDSVVVPAAIGEIVKEQGVAKGQSSVYTSTGEKFSSAQGRSNATELANARKAYDAAVTARNQEIASANALRDSYSQHLATLQAQQAAEQAAKQAAEQAAAEEAARQAAAKAAAEQAAKQAATGQTVEQPVTTKPIQTIPAGETVVTEPVPQVVQQEVTPPTYANQAVQQAQPATQPVTQPVTQPATQQVQQPYQAPKTGTFATPLQTAGLSAVPQTVTYKTHYAGTPGLVDPALYAPIGGGTGVGQVVYTNNLGQQIVVTEVNGNPVTYVPPGFSPAGSQSSTPTDTTTNPNTQTTQQTSYTGPMSWTFGMGEYIAPPDPSQLGPNQKLVTGPDGWYVQNTDTSPTPTGVLGSLGTGVLGSLGRDKIAGGGTAGYADGGQVQDTMLEAKYRIATMNGYNGPKTNAALNNFASATPAMKAKFNAIGAALAKGGFVRGFAPGGSVTSLEDFQQMQQNLVTQTMQPIQAPVSYIQPTAAEFIPVDAGQTTPAAPYAEAATVQTVQQAELPTATPAATITPSTVTPQVQAVADATQAAQGTVSEQAQVQAAQQQETSVSNLQAAQGVASLMDNPVQREIQAGELISGVANAETAAAFTEQIQAAQATPTKQATVQGQLETLMSQFEGGETPAWAAGSMRTAMATLAERGLGASSLAGQAVIQAAMEAALPIAQLDAQTQASFESQNLSNRQQMAMQAAQQRAAFLNLEFDQAFQARVQNAAKISDVANMNFTAEQQIALENSRAVNTMNLQNLNNSQALVMANAAALSQLDMANLNNRQQAAVQNAQNFMQMDMQNLSNEQQTTLFKSQQVMQALFTDQAAENAAAQFNAASENQTNQFFATLSNQTSQFNASQQNAMDQFNVNSVNALRQFNSEMQNQRDMFNAQNGLVIAQANAQWRQNLTTLNTAAQNESNKDFAATMNALTAMNLDEIWQRERDTLSMAWQSAESNADRALSITLQKMAADATIEAAKFQADVEADIAAGTGWANVVSSVVGII